MKVAIYARVSTDDKEQNPERQVDACMNYIELHNHKHVVTITEHITGNSNPFMRPEFFKLLGSDIEGIVIYEISRLSREHPSKVMHRLQDLKNRGIKVISITEPAFNMDGDFSDLLQYIMAWFNNYYLTNLSRNVKSGLERAKKQGKTLGRPKKKVNLYEIARELEQPNASISSVSKKLKIPRSSIYNYYSECVKKGIMKKK